MDILPKMLDPDPDSMNPDPKLLFLRGRTKFFFNKVALTMLMSALSLLHIPCSGSGISWPLNFFSLKWDPFQDRSDSDTAYTLTFFLIPRCSNTKRGYRYAFIFILFYFF